MLSETPAGCRHVKRDGATLRRKLEAAVMAAYGSLTITTESQINLACRNEVKALLAAKWLRDNPTMAPTDKLAMADAITSATAARDAAIRALKLNGHVNADHDPWSAIHRAPLPAQAADTPPAQHSNGDAEAAVQNEPRNGEGNE